MWHVYRAGRITASNFKSAVHTSPDKPSTSPIKKICYPESNRFTTKATQWGIENEQLAIASFLKMAKQSHTSIQVKSCGLMIKSSASYLDASPDGIVEYNCCGRGVLEVKCLYQCKERSFKDSSTDSTFCLESINDTNASLPFGLRKNHSYYYQVQLKFEKSIIATLLSGALISGGGTGGGQGGQPTP